MGLILADVRLVDGLADSAREHVDVAVGDDGRIATITDHVPLADSAPSNDPGQRRIDGRGMTVLPGLVDCHVHYTVDARLEVADGISDAVDQDPAESAFIGARNAAAALRAGVTTARSAGAAHSRDIALRDAIAAGHIPGPRLLAAGGAITITGGHGWQFGYEADGSDELVKLARRLARDGVDHFKIVASEAAQITTAVAGVEELTEDEIRAVVSEARRLKRRVMSHAQNPASVIASARGGVDSVEHAFLADRAALEVLAECGTTLVPTLTVTDVYRDIPGVSDAVRARQAELTVLHRRSCETAIELGVPMAAGTDCGVRGVLPDMVWREIANLHDHGLSAMDAIKAGTSGGAGILGLADEIGCIAPGYRADLVVVEGDPLRDLRRLAAPRFVIQDGVVVHEGRAP